ncbi:Flp family type IVb pilin [uncultured Desulfovibrio sp.]|jgi:pilus assembly protein Flp/PilA|uniref:Flp family type IVb pilin n=1 Tax=uncultured Desulfovibrio sp. TaxID=167968 RepID=UPI002201B6A6|nr:Flp family type IVb pilin [uncultured Desulfovibrio sp.]CAI3219708.1 Flp pilus assembly protein, pilin Flp [Desulfovibrio diazotrophicus]
MQLVQYVLTFGKLLKQDQRGVTAIEYGILAAGVAVLIGSLVASDGTFSQTLSSVFQNILNQLPQAESK